MLRKISALFFITSLLFAWSTQQIFAQEAFNATVSPHFFDTTLTPGGTFTQTVRIRNNNDTPMPLSIQIKKLIPQDNGSYTLADFTKADDYAKWLKVTVASVSAAPQEWTDIPFSVHIPPSGAFGYYWAIMIGATSSSAKTAERVNGAIAIPILVAVEKEGISFRGAITNFATSQNWYEYPPITFLTTISNTGNVHIKPRGNIFISDWQGKQVAALDINADAGNILPNAKRIFMSTWNNSFITEEIKTQNDKAVLDKNGKPEKQLHIDFQKLLSLRIGKYTAHALVVISGDKHDTLLEASTSFFVFPWKIVVGGFLFVLLAMVGFVTTGISVGKQVSKLFRKNKN